MIAAAIPIFNEAATIGSVVEETMAQVDAVVVIDDGSTDDGARIAGACGATVVHHATNSGKGVALRTALAWARAQPALEYLVLIDGDGQHDASDIPRLLAEAAVRELDIVVGSRFLGHNNAPIYRLFGLHVLSASASLGSGIHLTDSQSGFRVLSRRAIDHLSLTESSFAVETEMQFKGAAQGLRVGEIPIRIRYTGPARRSPVVHGVSVLLQTIKMTAFHRPLRLPLLVATPVLAARIGQTRRVLMNGRV